ncbi:hypothetical protein L227DRAFT_189033 [Lentinus tigrinus ALCF2SS1-6]|uniref:Uncharacterized protein n=1 Tax=Lentinus tigrinus ALCF2SS1-6 TaxID=1328759 RepID=A0A5C2S644_9APHY|nr:hypothetical protein L227DRAFT_189033 [Lentinus tigrinus ALCF2SS1-6]
MCARSRKKSVSCAVSCVCAQCLSAMPARFDGLADLPVSRGRTCEMIRAGLERYWIVLSAVQTLCRQVTEQGVRGVGSRGRSARGLVARFMELVQPTLCQIKTMDVCRQLCRISKLEQTCETSASGVW